MYCLILCVVYPWENGKSWEISFSFSFSIFWYFRFLQLNPLYFWNHQFRIYHLSKLFLFYFLHIFLYSISKHWVQYKSNRVFKLSVGRWLPIICVGLLSTTSICFLLDVHTHTLQKQEVATDKFCFIANFIKQRTIIKFC